MTAVFFTAIAFLELLQLGNEKKNFGSTSSQIIVTSSIAAYLRQIFTGFAYPSSKAAVDHLAKSLSTHLMPHRIRVNTLNPGSFPSMFPGVFFTIDLDADGFSKAEMTEQLVEKVLGFSADSQPGGRLGNEEDLAGAALYLCSKAGAYLNGLALVIDGGALSVTPSSY